MFFVLIFFSLFLWSAVCSAQEPEIFLVTPLSNGLKSVEKLDFPSFYLPKDDEFEIKVFLEPQKERRPVVISRKEIPFEGSCPSGWICKFHKDQARFLILDPQNYFSLHYQFDNTVNVFDYPLLRFRFRSDDFEPNIRVIVEIDSDGDKKSDVSFEGFYPVEDQPITHLYEEKIADQKFVPKSYIYLVKRELGLSVSPEWRYSYDNQNTFLQKRYNLPIKEGTYLKLIFSRDAPFRGVNFFIDSDGNGRKDHLVLWEQMVKNVTKNDNLEVEIDLAQTLKKLNIDISNARLYELIVYLQAPPREVIEKKFFKELILLKKGVAESSPIPVEGSDVNGFREVYFDVKKALEKAAIYNGKILALKVSLFFKERGEYLFYTPEFVNKVAMPVSKFLFEPLRELKRFLPVSFFPDEYVSAFDVFWFRDFSLHQEDEASYERGDLSFPPLHVQTNDCFYRLSSDNGTFSWQGYFLPSSPLNKAHAYWQMRIDLPFDNLSKLEISGLDISGDVEKWVKFSSANGEALVPLGFFLQNGSLLFTRDYLKDMASVSILLFPESPGARWQMFLDDLKVYLCENGQTPSHCKERVISYKFIFSKLEQSFKESSSGVLFRIRAPRLLATKDLSLRVPSPLFFVSHYEGLPWLRLLLLGEGRKMSFFVPHGYAVPLPKVEGKFRLELWAKPDKALKSLSEPSKEWLFLKDWALLTFEKRALSEENELPSRWFQKEARIFVAKKELFPPQRSFLLSWKVPKEIRRSQQPQRFVLRYAFSDPVRGKVFLKDRRHPRQWEIEDEGEIVLPLDDWEELPSELVLEWKLVPSGPLSPLLIEEAFFEVLAVPVSWERIFQETVPGLLLLDGRPLHLDWDGRQTLFLEGDWLVGPTIRLGAGEHQIELRDDEDFILRAVVLEAKSIYPPPEELSGQVSPPSRHFPRFLGRFFKVALLAAGLFLLFRWKRIRPVLRAFKERLARLYGILPDPVYAFLWFVLAAVFYEKGLGELAQKGENLWWTWGGIFLVLSYHHFIKAVKGLLTRHFPRLSKYVYRGPGTPYICGFIVILLFCALLLLMGLEPVANQLAIIGYYLLVVGVVKEFWAFVKQRDKEETV